MNIGFNSLFIFNSGVDFISIRLSMSPLKQKIAIVALAILSCFSLYYFACYYPFKAKKVDSDEGDVPPESMQQEVEKTKAVAEKINIIELQSQAEASPAHRQKVEKPNLKDVPLTPKTPKKEGLKAKAKEFVEKIKNFEPKSPEKPSPDKRKAVDDKKFEKPKGDKENLALPFDISQTKIKALNAYRHNPEKCGKVQKINIFKEIQTIEPKKKQDALSVIGLMLYLSESQEVDLNHPICAQVVVDIFKECNQETCDELVKWLSQEKTFHVHLLKRCLKALIERLDKQIATSLYSFEALMKFYQTKSWNQVKNAKDKSILPANHHVILSVMAILIQARHNEDRVVALSEWMMNQDEYDLETFSQWVRIFQQKDKQQKEPGLNIRYILLEKMMDHFKVKWESNHFDKLKSDVSKYLLTKDPEFRNAWVQAELN